LTALLHDLAAASRDVADLPGRLDKVRRLADALRGLPQAWAHVGVAYLSGQLPQGRIGIGPAMLFEALEGASADQPTLTVGETHAVFDRIAATTGAGSTAARGRLLRDLLARATEPERDFLARLLMGELRQGASEGVLLEAVALASGLPASDVRRAAMLRGSTAAVGGALLGGGAAGAEPLDDALELFRPVKPMLAQTADGVEDALERLGEAAFEVKFDGARVQVHRAGDDVRVFTRRLNDETAALPEVVEAVRALPVREIVLDGEAIALRSDGTPRPFQETMTRFGRKRDLDGARASVPLSSFFFDVLYLDGTPLIDRPAAERWSALEQAVPPAARAPRLVTRAAEAADALMRDARARGHEGLMAKALDAPYVAGRRGSAWLKVKPSFTADLVVLAAEWGHGRRTGWLSNLHLGARGDAPGEWVMVGKTFKGMTDALLAWQTERLLALAEKQTKHVVRVRPELVVEVAFDGVQASPRYAGGLALRFARVKGYREDKTPAEADRAAWLAEIRDRSG
jgi:DNA ligase-1